MTNLALPSEPEVRVAGPPGETAVISLLGEHDIATAWEVRNVIACALKQGTHPVVDLSETESSTPRSSMFSSRASSSPKNMDGGSACNCRQTPVSDGRSKSQRCSTYCLSTEPAPRRSTRSGSRVTRTQKGGKDGAPLGSNHPARLVRSHRRARDHEVPLLRAGRSCATGVDRILHSTNGLRRLSHGFRSQSDSDCRRRRDGVGRSRVYERLQHSYRRLHLARRRHHRRVAVDDFLVVVGGAWILHS